MPGSREATSQKLAADTHEKKIKKNNEEQLTEMGAMNHIFKQRQQCNFERDHIVSSDATGCQARTLFYSVGGPQQQRKGFRVPL